MDVTACAAPSNAPCCKTSPDPPYGLILAPVIVPKIIYSENVKCFHLSPDVPTSSQVGNKQVKEEEEHQELGVPERSGEEQHDLQSPDLRFTPVRRCWRDQMI